MKDKIMNDLIRVNNDLVLPGYIVKNYDKLNIDGYELIMLLYFINQKNNITFDISKISSDLNFDSAKVFELINSLNEKNFISIEMKKNNGVIEEFVSTDLFINKVATLLVEKTEDTDDNDIYSVFEKEFGRTLSPTEYENISKWIENGISEDLIIEALKEAILNGVSNIRYIDSILFNWVKKGYKQREDIKRKKTASEEIETIYEYDWLNE